jgi:hypothetical protein
MPGLDHYRAVTVIRNMQPVPLTRLVEEFTDRLLVVELPALPADRRGETVAFTGRRVAALPTPMRLGLTVVAAVVAGVGRLAGLRRITRMLASRPLPVLSDYVRLVRSLAYAYVWETWPSTAADGAAR